jgi:SAM-dependent methyltransferase
VAEMASTGSGVDWDRVHRSAREMRSTRMLRFGLRLAHDLLEADLPAEILQPVLADRAVWRLTEETLELLLSDEVVNPGVAQRLVYRTRMHDGAAEGLRRTLRLATSPTEDDWAQGKFSPRFSWWHALMRPAHLVKKYGWGLRMRAAPDLAPYIPTPMPIVERMLELAEIQPGDILYDLGCGDGRILTTAAKVYGICCVGIDIDPVRIGEAWARIRAAGVEGQVTLRQEDAKTAEVSPANVVMLYLTIPGNLKLWERLEKELRPGTRVVTRDFEMPGWTLNRAVELEVPGTPVTTLFLWRIGDANRPASAAEAREGGAGDMISVPEVPSAARSGR